MDSGIGEIIQVQQTQQQPTATTRAQAEHRELYGDWSLTVLMGYAQVNTESVISIIWGKFQIFKECADNHQYQMAGMMY